MNGKKATPPCPCGNLGHPAIPCRCNEDVIARYGARISGPLLDRIDLHVSVPALTPAELDAAQAGEPSAKVRARVVRARSRQVRRQSTSNANLAGVEAEARARIDSSGRALLREASTRLALSARARHRVIKVARTIADLAASDRVESDHLAEALTYR